MTPDNTRRKMTMIIMLMMTMMMMTMMIMIMMMIMILMIMMKTIKMIIIMIDLSFKSYTIAHTRITSRQFGVPLGS